MSTVKMSRGLKFADVHKDEVKNWSLLGWSIVKGNDENGIKNNEQVAENGPGRKRPGRPKGTGRDS